MTIKIAQISCGTEYSGIQSEIENAASTVGGKMVYPDVSYEEIGRAVDEFGFDPASPQLKLMIARAKALADGHYDADAVFIATCFRCAEGALVRNEVRRCTSGAYQAARRDILVHREAEGRSALDQDGGPGHHRGEEGAIGQGAPGRIDRGDRLWLLDDEGDDPPR